MGQEMLLMGAGTVVLVVVLAGLMVYVARLHRRLGEAERRSALAEQAERDIASLRDELKAANTARESAERNHAALKASSDAAERHHAEKLAELEKARKDLTESFKLTANEVLKASGAELNEQSAKNLQTLLNPLREQLGEFQKRVIDDAKERTGQTSALHQLVDTLHKNAVQISQDATNLTNALKSSSKVRGDWGELVLERILSRAGLREGEEFETQSHETDAEGRRLRPDIVVNMPGGHRLVIDSKVSLNAFEACVNAETEEQRAAFLKQHIASVRTHVKSLGEKDYAALYDGVDFTLMFIPLEGAAVLALQNDHELVAYALDRGVMIASPTNLTMAMRTVQNLWTIERQNQNAQAIAERAGLLYDKLVGFVEELDKVGQRIDQAHGAWATAKERLVTGRGNVIRQTEMLKALGAKTKKALPDGYRDAADDDDDAPLIEGPDEDSPS
ncbi:DNA recombination protein RmuC [Hyphobacterium marinum]|uniref:DNA recombination protein RmuC homolog n=1 Tax=Hyphobacterium marinum TaxID=3116574 RepID=A0ABU7LWB2_9PROT|nr:DNA recombination protein RmuC [Hyphobacterium sp. Y6023]MEE2565820.1 DNA recombination protein RmuC [Hyphobacterium sp. Y6023]